MRSLIISLLLSATFLSAQAQNNAGVDPLDPAKREFQQGKLDAALTALVQAEKDGASPALLLDLRGCVLLEQQKYDEAIAAFDAAHEAEPAIFLPQLHRGDALRRQSRWVEAREAYEAIMRQTNVLMLHERLRFGVLMTYLGAKDDAGAKDALDRITFPTETPAYYYSQAAWAFAHGTAKAGQKWMSTADKIFDAKQTSWFTRPLHDFGWVKTKPPLTFD